MTPASAAPRVLPRCTRRQLFAGALAAIGAASAATLGGCSGEGIRREVFYVPHQDDELLTFGAALVEAVASGAPIEVVLLTRGETSAVRRIMVENGEMIDDPDVFSAARTREMRAALGVLGIPWSRVHLGGAPTDAAPAR